MNLVERFESGIFSFPRKTDEHVPLPLIVTTDAMIVWGSLALVSLGYCFHRMGPAFERSRFGSPVALLGLTCLIILPRDIEGPESSLHGSFVELISWVAPFSLGFFLVLRGVTTYWKVRPLEMSFGWLSIVISWYIFSQNLNSDLVSEAVSGLWASLGLILGLVAFLIGVILAEKNSRFLSESAPLSKGEKRLVRTILERRLGGEKGDT